MALKCFVCKRTLTKKEAIFRKGKFFGSKDCLNKYDKKVKQAVNTKVKKKNVCEFC